MRRAVTTRRVRTTSPIAWVLAVVLLAVDSLPLLADSSVTAPIATKGDGSADLLAERARHMTRTGAVAWHEAGARGQGVKVAILDTGFRGYRAHLGKALPPRVTARSFRADGDLEARDSQHGILCGEVVHALAPAAELLLATWEPDRPEQFLEAVRWARHQGARVLSCSVIMPTWSDGEGNGPIHRELRGLVGDGAGAGDALFVASAGNTAERHWSGPLRPGAGGWHEWRAGVVDNPLRPWGDEAVSVELCASRDVAFEVRVWDATTGDEVGRARGRSSPDGSCAAVRFVPETGRAYRVRVRRVEGEGGTFHVVALGANLDQVSARGSIAFPGDGPEVVAVGAVGADGRRAEYSSCGPNSRQPKPDLVAMEPFPSLWRGQPFSGTSAAAPQAAALAALLWSRAPRWTARRVRQALVESARDLAEPGHDCETGYGLIALPTPK